MDKLPDLLAPNLRVVFCGTASGKKSAENRAYYAHPSNRFWRVLAKIGLTPHQLTPQEFPDLLQYSIGLTDLAKTQVGMDKEVQYVESDVGVLKAKIEQFQPMVLAFTSKEAAKRFYGRKQVDFGRQEERLGETVVFILPSTSGLATSSWNESYWHELATFLNAQPKGT